MSGPREGDPALASEVLRDLAPDLAWGYEYFEGLLLVSHRACEAYGLEPVVEVKPPEKLDMADTSEIMENIPRTNITVVGPDEMKKIEARMSADEQAKDIDPTLKEMVYGIEGGRIDIVLDFDVTAEQAAEEQTAFFEGMYGEVWAEIQRRNSSDELPYRVSHAIADSTSAAIDVVLPHYWHMQGLGESVMLIDKYRVSVGSSVHGVFCPEEHIPDDWEIPDAI